MYYVKDKVALVTGGAVGIGFAFVEELLQKGIRAVTIADINDEAARHSVQRITDKYGANKAIYVKTDVANKSEFNSAFQKTIQTFGNIDILINNAGILNDKIWEKEVAINLNGTINGITLALDQYFPKHRTAEDSTIINISSNAGLRVFPSHPVYMATKFAVQAMSRGFGSKEHYERTKTRVIALCPGATATALIDNMVDSCLGPRYQELADKLMNKHTMQTPEHVAKSLMTVLKEGKSGSVWLVENGKEVMEVEFALV